MSDNKNLYFDYGIVEVKHRFNINRSLDDYKVITLNKCYNLYIVYKLKTVDGDRLFPEVQISYKDEDNNLRCLKADLHEFTFAIKHKGDMQINL